MAFVSSLMEADVKFEAVEFPQANELTIHIMAAVAEHEAKAIPARTRAALAAAKRRGVKLGGIRKGHKPFATRVAAMGAESRNCARKRAAGRPCPHHQRDTGGRSNVVTGIAAALNERSIPTAKGQDEWKAAQVARVLARLSA